MLGILRSGDVVIAAKLDRMFRSCVDAVQQLEDFKKRSIKLYLLDLGGEVTGDGISGLVFTILSAVAQFERERIAERITEAKAHCREKGMYAGGDIPFGYKKTIGKNRDGSWILIKNSKEQEIIKFIIKQRVTKGSLRAIALRVRDVYKVPMSHTLVKRILERETGTH